MVSPGLHACRGTRILLGVSSLGFLAFTPTLPPPIISREMLHLHLGKEGTVVAMLMWRRHRSHTSPEM